jgi:hypothetical protein
MRDAFEVKNGHREVVIRTHGCTEVARRNTLKRTRKEKFNAIR